MQVSAIIEIVGYIGSALVLVSFLMTSVFKLRIVNMIGSMIFCIYALIIRSYPTAIMNICLVLINLHFLWKMSHLTRNYRLVDVAPTDDFLCYLLQAYGDDIRSCFPGIEVHAETAKYACITTCENKPVGIFLASGRHENLEVMLDYSIPEYRDFSIGNFLFHELKARGVQKLSYSGPTEKHLPYLQKMGFKKTDTAYVKYL